MLLACMQCDFHFNGIFNILIIHTYIYVIPHFQGMSFTFNVKKKVKKYIKQLNKTHIIWKNDFIACAARARGKVYIALILWKSVRKTKFNKKNIKKNAQSVFFSFLPKILLRGFQYTSFIYFFFVHFFIKYSTLVCTQNLQLKIPRKHSNSIF